LLKIQVESMTLISVYDSMLHTVVECSCEQFTPFFCFSFIDVITTHGNVV
jgi:hypothetical protein